MELHMNLCRFFVAVIIASAASQAVAQPASNDFKQTKEWKALNRYVGSWGHRVSVTVPQTEQSRLFQMAAWTVGGRFLQIKLTLDDASESMYMLTYDPNRQAIRCWFFSSAGDTSVATGHWDEATNTFSFKAENPPRVSITLADHIIDDDHHDWKVTIKDAADRIVYEASSQAARLNNARKESATVGGAEPTPLVQSQRKIKQLLIGVLMYATDHRNALPDNIEQIAGSYVKDDKALRNPRQPDRERGYVWVKPAAKLTRVLAPSQVIMLYEAYDKWPEGGLVVGFMDGHVELLQDEATFKQKLPPPDPIKPAP